jgi:hypothetical protein
MMRRYRLVLSTVLFCLFLVGCSSLVYKPNPTPFPVDYVPTIIALTVQAGEEALVTPSPVVVLEDTPTASPTPIAGVDIVSTIGPSPTSLAFNPTSTPSPEPSASATTDLNPTATTWRRATHTPTITPTPTIPVAFVQISEPGPMSKVSSPLELIANLRSIPSGSYHVEIWLEPLQSGGEARLLYREVKKLISNPVPWIYLDPDIQFELSRVSEFGQVRVSMLDKYGRLASVNSVDVILLSMGESDITPTGYLSEPIVIREPTLNHLIQGGVVIVSGEVRPSESSMLVELVTFDGIVVGYANAFVIPSDDGSYVPYAVEVPYIVTTPTWVRLQISESSVRIPGVEHLSSVEVLLSP